jgi:23S rRNA pseudouridine1911/1915/1917 synthase
MIHLTVANADRLDRCLALTVAGLSRNEAEVLIARGGVRVSGKVCRKKGARVAAGEQITVDTAVLEDRSPAERVVLAAKEEDLRLLDRGDDWAVIRKPAALGSTPRFFGDALAFSVFASRLLAAHWPEPRALPDDGLVHRLDVGTSGGCVFARDDAALARLIADRNAGRLRRTYWAIVSAGVPDEGAITTAIAHDRADERKMVIASDVYRGTPQRAQTRYRTLARAVGAALVEVGIDGGRRHQIRVHMASIGFALRGDELYGGAGDPARLALHATYVDLQCPKRGAVRVAADPGEHFWAFAPELARSPA